VREKYHLEGLGVDETIILKGIFKELNGKAWLDWSGSG
jgi:hypothetical protein